MIGMSTAVVLEHRAFNRLAGALDKETYGPPLHVIKNNRKTGKMNLFRGAEDQDNHLLMALLEEL